MKKLTPTQRQRVEQHVDFMQRIVMQVSKKFPRRIEALDLHAAGYCGLCAAAQTWDESRGKAFTSWVYLFVRREALREALWILNWKRHESCTLSRIGSPLVTCFEAERTGRRDYDFEQMSDICSRRMTGPDFWRDLACEYVRGIVTRLGPELRDVIEKVYFDDPDRTWDEKAEDLGLTIGTFMGRRTKALRALWLALGDEEAELYELIGRVHRKPTKDISAWARLRNSGYFTKRATGRRASTLPVGDTSQRRRP